MPTITETIVYIKFGAHSRQPRTGGGIIINTYSTSGPKGVVAPYPTSHGLQNTTIEGVTYIYAFTTISDGNSLGVVTTDPYTLLDDLYPITVQYVFVPQDGSGTGDDDGIFIDAFDANSGVPVDNNFVSGVTNSTSTFNDANTEGWVDTTSATKPVQITADLTIGANGPTPPNAPQGNYTFVKWQSLTGALQAPDSTLTAAAQSNGSAWAIYQMPVKPPKESKESKEHKESKEYKESHEKIPYKGEYGSEKIPINEHGNQDALYPPRNDHAAMELLNRRVAALESTLSTAIKRKAFIRESERPKVGLPPEKKKKR